jgi:hypothetical protein
VTATTNNQHPTTNIQQPTSNNQQPTTNNQQPTTNNQQPTTNNQQPTTNNQQPTTKASNADSRGHIRGTSTDQSVRRWGPARNEPGRTFWGAAAPDAIVSILRVCVY